MRRSRRVNLEGNTYCGWDILKFVGFSSNRFPRYECKCVCGKERVVSSRGSILTSKSCGCKNQGRWKKGTFAPEHEVDRLATLRGRYRRDSIARGHKFELTNQEFNELVIGECYYCGSKQESSQMYNNLIRVKYTGIDRVDNDIGYIKSNCVPCCKECNIVKKAVTKEIIQKAYKFLFGE